MVPSVFITTRPRKKPPDRRGAADSRTTDSEVAEHLIHFVPVDRWIIPPQTVAVGFAVRLQVGDQVIVSAVPVDSCQAVEVLFIADPEGSAPGLPVCPSVERGGVGGEGLRVECFEGCCHWFGLFGM